MTDKTVWRQVIELYNQPGVDWGFYEPKMNVDGVECYCVGGALAQVLTGDPVRMYSGPGDEDFSPEVDEALTTLADYVYGPRISANSQSYKRVYRWNDGLNRADGKSVVLKTLAELDDLESVK